MPTIKTRVNLSVPTEVNQALEKIAKRDQVSISTKALDLIRLAMEFEEDMIFNKLAEQREKTKGKLVKHADAWL